MSSYVADANVIFSALISGKSVYLRLASQHQLYLPDYALEEIQQYQNLITERTKQAPVELKEYILALFKLITVLPNTIISLRSHLAAFELCKDIDRQDMVYLALSIELNYPFLTRDKILAEGLRTKGYTNVVTLDELLSQTNELGSTN
jgi:predicted nucleic acid-binding protein